MELETLEVKIQAQARQANGQIDALITRLGKLSSSLQSIDSSGINRLATGVNRLSNSMSAMRSVDSRSFSTLARNIKTLSNIDTGKINAAAGAMRQISKSVSSFSVMSKSVQWLSELAGGIKQLGYTSSTKAIENIPKLAVAMRQLMAELSKAPMVSQNLINMTNALAKLARTGGAAGTAARSITSSFGGFTSGASAATKKSFSLASAIGKLYASYFLLFRGFGKIRDAIDISSSLTEVENVVRTVFGKYESLVNDFAANSIQKFGMSELSVKQFASRFQAMGVAMGFSQGKMADMSINLTKLTADMASFYDVAQSDVAEDLESIFTGQTRPLRAYGLDLTQATLKEWALTQGIEANFKTMTQAEKSMLRYQYVMANTAAAQGDFARTADTWHNQVTILKQSFQQLAGIIGGALINAFKPFLKVLNAVLQKVISFAEMVTNALGSIFGWKYEASDVGITDDLADSYGDVADAANDAANGTKKAAKEAKKSTRAFDELKVISSNKDKGSSGSGSGSSGGGGGASGSSGKLVAADTIFKDYESKIKDLEGLGEAISGALISAMQGIDWDSVYAAADGFGTGLAQFLNGLFKDQKGTTLFGEVGTTIAGALNTVLHGLDSFGETFDWKQFGNSIADGINNFFQNFDFALLAQTLNYWAQGAFDAVATALSKISWKDVWEGVKEFLSNLDVKTVAIIIGALTIKKILKLHLAKAVLGIIGTAISKKIASAIASKLGVEIAANSTIGSVLSDALSKKISGLGTIAGKIGKLSLTVGSIVIAAEGGLALGEAIGNKIADATQPEDMKQYRVDFKFSDLFSYSLDDWRQGFSDWWNDTWGPGFDEFWKDNMSGDFKFKIPFTSIELPSHNEMGKAINNWLKKEKKNIEKKLDNIVQITAEVKDTSSKWWSDVKKYWSEKVGKVKEFATNVKNNAKDWWENTKKWWGKKVGNVESFTTGVKNKASEWWSNVKKWWKNTTAGKEVKKFTANVKKNGSGWWSDVKTEWNNSTAGKTLTVAVGFAKNALGNMWSSVTKFFGGKTVSVSAKATKKADGGVFSGGSWKPIKKYAVGGLPNMGQMFVAREAGPELVGNLGGHTAVMNNDQIVASVSDGVYRAVKAAMGNGQPVNVTFKVEADSKGIFKVTQEEARQFFNRTGTAPYPV
nr:MAG TPA: minor tail protein [Caudoviricetes sp.]